MPPPEDDFEDFTTATPWERYSHFFLSISDQLILRHWMMEGVDSFLATRTTFSAA
jgi:hypothetical protein